MSTSQRLREYLQKQKGPSAKKHGGKKGRKGGTREELQAKLYFYPPATQQR